jgi:hypothetical protein
METIMPIGITGWETHRAQNIIHGIIAIVLLCNPGRGTVGRE